MLFGDVAIWHDPVGRQRLCQGGHAIHKRIFDPGTLLVHRGVRVEVNRRTQVQLLHDIGLAAPDSVELCWELNKEGFNLPLDKLDPIECAQTLYDMVKA